ncbi:hypothetical protein [Brachyspira innocens]|uniref:hypothetical protein n=1 Tax=Brachyspira innocens TaxID=13264 RepID=UPI0026EC2BE7|nr:hypothetical protein [Brachyspira innocens]
MSEIVGKYNLDFNTVIMTVLLSYSYEIGTTDYKRIAIIINKIKNYERISSLLGKYFDNLY